MVDMFDSGTINNRAAQEIFTTMAVTAKDPEAIMKEKGLQQMGDASELEAILKEIAANPDKVARLKVPSASG
jgi:aspartyl-tRNA(Asn)/glutamyl-tRNA(Gln) amidotransferase subunit B